MVALFWTCFVLTLALIGATVWSGWTGRRRAHFVFAPTMIVMLAVTVMLTEQLARRYEFPERELGIHLVFAKTAAALVVPVVATGIVTARRRSWLRAHLVCVILFVVASLTATGTGLWVFSLSGPS